MKMLNQVKITFASRSVNEGFARAALAAFLVQLDPTVPQLADLKTAVSEAVTNCIVHAYPDGIGPVTLTAALYEGGVCASPSPIAALASPMWTRLCSLCTPPATPRNARALALRSCKALWIRCVFPRGPGAAPA